MGVGGIIICLASFGIGVVFGVVIMCLCAVQKHGDDEGGGYYE